MGRVASAMTRSRAISVAASLAILMLLGFGVRLVLGMRTQIDADEAALALAGLHLNHGQFVLMEPDAQYLGALDAYVSAPFIALLGPGLLAVRLALAVTGALYVLSMYALGRVLFKSHRAGLLTAGVAAVFPLFAVYWSAKLRGGYVELPIFEAVALILCARIGWGTRGWFRWWALLGFVVGLALWSDVLIAVVFAVIATALLVRAPVTGWRRTLRGGALACVTGLIGLAPWIAYNVPNHLHSIRAIPRAFTSFTGGVSALVNDQLPVFVGGSSDCRHTIVPTAVSDGSLVALLVAVLWLRRRSLRNIVSGGLSEFEPLDVCLVLVPATLIYLAVSRLDSIPCEPRYLMPLAVPLVIAVATVLLVRWSGRWISLVATAAWLTINVIAAAGSLPDMSDYAVGSRVPFDLGPGISMIRAQHPTAVWAQFWLSHPLAYFSGDTLPIGEYGGYVGFPQRQMAVETALHPSWVFVEGQAGMAELERVCHERGITYSKITGGGLVLYTHLTGTVEPSDVIPGPAGRTD
ncbi:MAG: hypothetical protein E6J45_07810 [Chloroflexi bacterium]|nr:MAG: hypothetical protein E6J45_07810 [Chloroflexota bacterium]